MDEEQFELMYKFPGAEKHIPLPSALDQLWLMCTELQVRLDRAEDRNIALEQEVIRISDDLNTHIRNHD